MGRSWWTGRRPRHLRRCRCFPLFTVRSAGARHDACAWPIDRVKASVMRITQRGADAQPDRPLPAAVEPRNSRTHIRARPAQPRCDWPEPLNRSRYLDAHFIKINGPDRGSSRPRHALHERAVNAFVGRPDFAAPAHASCVSDRLRFAPDAVGLLALVHVWQRARSRLCPSPGLFRSDSHERAPTCANTFGS